MGQAQQDTLPWRIEAARRQAEYDAQPKCFVDREWLRLALKTLARQIEGLCDDTPVSFDYRQQVLSIECNGQNVVTPAAGKDWPKPIVVQVRSLRGMPKRIKTENVCVLVCERYLLAGSVRLAIIDNSHSVI